MFIAGSSTTITCMFFFADKVTNVTGVLVSLIIIVIVVGITSVLIAIIILLWRRKVTSELQYVIVKIKL